MLFFFAIFANRSESQGRATKSPPPASTTLISAQDNPVSDAQLQKDLDLANFRVELVDHMENFYQFSVSPINGHGGVLLISKREPTGHFIMIWEGQDYPDCKPILNYKIPAAMVPFCFAASVLISR